MNEQELRGRMRSITLDEPSLRFGSADVIALGERLRQRRAVRAAGVGTALTLSLVSGSVIFATAGPEQVPATGDPTCPTPMVASTHPVPNGAWCEPRDPIELRQKAEIAARRTLEILRGLMPPGWEPTGGANFGPDNLIVTYYTADPAAHFRVTVEESGREPRCDQPATTCRELADGSRLVLVEGPASHPGPLVMGSSDWPEGTRSSTVVAQPLPRFSPVRRVEHHRVDGTVVAVSYLSGGDDVVSAERLIGLVTDPGVHW